MDRSQISRPAGETRWTDFPFPAYTYIPGKTPHPTRESDGHSFGRPEPHVEQFDSSNWIKCPAFLFGIDLFNAGFYWESHEQWEAIWHAVGRTGRLADFLKGLIKLSAAGVKTLEGRPIGVRRHLQRAVELFLAVGEQHDSLCGFAIADIIQKANAANAAVDGKEYADHATTADDDERANGLPFTLQPIVR